MKASPANINAEPAPPQLRCPSCDEPLTYLETVLSNVKPPERWDQFECRACGRFEFRHRTRQLRSVE